MTDPTPVLSYATPTRPDSWWRRLGRDAVGPDRWLAVVQLLAASIAVLVAVGLFGPYGYSAGPWPTRLAWAWLPTGAAAANAAAAAALAVRGATAAARRWYVAATLGNLGVTLAALAVVAHWPSYVVVAPFAPPVNDRVFVFNPDLYVKAPAWLLVVNPMLFLLLARGTVRSLRDDPPDKRGGGRGRMIVTRRRDDR